MAREVSSITRVGTSEPFELQVARNQISFHKSIYKFGNNAEVSNSTETIWQQGGLYSYLSAASVLKGRLKLKKSKEPQYTKKNCSWADLRLRRGSVGEEVLSDIKREW